MKFTESNPGHDDAGVSPSIESNQPDHNAEMKRLESRVRRFVSSHGYRLHKSRAYKDVPNFENYGEYMVIDNATNISLMGHRFDATLEDIEATFAD